MNSGPRSIGIGQAGSCSVAMRPPIRVRASSTVTESAAAERSRAAASPAAPAPRTIASDFVMPALSSSRRFLGSLEHRPERRDFGAPPPGAGPLPLGRLREAVLPEPRPHETRRNAGKRIAREEREHGRRALEQLLEKTREPGVLLEGAERREPHLPVEPRLVRRHERRTAEEVAR